MFVEMLDEDKRYLEEILSLFKITKYKLSETPTRFKLIINPKEFNMKTLHDVQGLKTPVGVEVDLKTGVYLECLKSGSSRKKRRLALDTFKGELPEKYKVGVFEPAIRILLGIEDICEFEPRIEGNVLLIKNIECMSYPILKHMEQEGFNLSFNIPLASMTIARAKLM